LEWRCMPPLEREKKKSGMGGVLGRREGFRVR